VKSPTCAKEPSVMADRRRQSSRVGGPMREDTSYCQMHNIPAVKTFYMGKKIIVNNTHIAITPLE